MRKIFKNPNDVLMSDCQFRFNMPDSAVLENSSTQTPPSSISTVVYMHLYYRTNTGDNETSKVTPAKG
ncbi:hypothetical protein DOY81_000076 [Sarcophaga bullata]|nr:hypothetical protein DOY81_000076 [Sarcophaga bullata]